MTEQQFAFQMNRLAKAFPNAYSDERIRLVWREIGSLEGSWLEKTVDRFIGEFRHAPLMPEFREAAAIERERVREIQKREEKQGAEAFMSALSESETRGICEQIRRRLQGYTSDAEFNQFQNVLSNVTKGMP